MGAPGVRDDDWALWRAFVTAGRGLDRALEQRLQHDADISSPEFDVLLALGEAEGRQLRAGALADALGWDRSRISHQVRRMADRGLLQRNGCATDARGTWVVMSEAGASALEQAVCGYAEVLRERFFGALGGGGRRSLDGAVRRLTRALGPAPAPGVRPPFSQTASTG